MAPWERVCDFCGGAASGISEAPRGQMDFMTVRCKACGLSYILVGAAEEQIRHLGTKALLAGFVFERNCAGETPRLQEEVYRQAENLRELSVDEKAARLLAELGRGLPLASMCVEHDLNLPRFRYAIYGSELQEVIAVAHLLQEDGLFAFTEEYGSTAGGLTPQGYRRAQHAAGDVIAPTGYARVDRALEKARNALRVAQNEEDFQAVGLLCREVFISLAQAVYVPARHLSGTDPVPSSTDAEEMLAGYFRVELGGQHHEEVRAYAKAALKLAVVLQHRRSAQGRDARLCFEATRSVVRLVETIATLAR